MKKRSVAIILLLVLVLTTFCACKPKLQKFSTYSFDYFDTVTTIVGYASSQEEFDAVSAEVLRELGECHRLFTIYHRYEGLENLCNVNELVNGAHRVVKVDDRIIQMLKYAKEMYAKTGGLVNVAMGSVLSIWHDYREAGRDEPWAAELPPMDKLLAASEHMSIDDLVIDEEAGTVFLADPQMRLDVGAIAKGYAVEMATSSTWAATSAPLARRATASRGRRVSTTPTAMRTIPITPLFPLWASRLLPAAPIRDITWWTASPITTSSTPKR